MTTGDIADEIIHLTQRVEALEQMALASNKMIASLNTALINTLKVLAADESN